MAYLNSVKTSAISQLGEGRALARLLENLPSIVAFALALVLAWQLAHLVWSLIPGAEEDAMIAVVPAATPQTPGSTARAPSAVDASSIVAAHLFGIAAPAEVVADTTVPDNVEETTLNLELKGTLAATTPADALAIIADGATEKVYRVNDAIRQNVTLHSVERDRVILDRSGQLEALKLPQEYASGAGSRRSGARAPVRAAQQRRTTTPSVAQVLTENQTQLLQIIRPAPYFQDGAMRGYRLYPSTNRKVFAEIGLRPGDIATAINGSPLTDPSSGAQIFADLGSTDSVSITIERDGVEQTLTVNTSQLDLSDEASR
jgi:general secretion pathway protein C